MIRLIVWLGLLGVAIGVLAAKAPVTTDLADFLGGDEHDPAIRRLVVAEMKEGVGSRSFVVALPSLKTDQMAEASDAMAERLRGLTFVQRIDNGRTPPFSFADSSVKRLFGWRYLLAPTPDFSPLGLRRSMEERLRDLSSPTAPLSRPMIPADPTGAFQAYLTTLADDAPPVGPAGVWSEEEVAYLTGTVTTPLTDAEYERLRHAVDGARLTGPAVFAATSRQQIRSEAEWISLAATTAMVLLFLVALRSPMSLLLLAAPMVTGGVAGVAVVTLVYGSIQGVTLAFGATIIGVAVDYPLHALMHAKGVDHRKESNLLWPTLRLSALTTAIGYGAMLFSDLPGLAQLGLFSVSGVIVAALSVRYILPPLLPTAPPDGAGEWLRPLGGNSLLRAAVAVLLAIGISVGAINGVRWNDDVGRLNPVSLNERQQYEAVRSFLAGDDAGKGIVAIADDADEALTLSTRVAERLDRQVADGKLAGYRDGSTILPTAAAQRKRQMALPDRATLEQRVRQAQEGLPFGAGVFAPFIADIEASRMTSPVTADEMATTPLGQALVPLLHRLDDRWISTTLLRGVEDEAAVAEVAATVPGAYYLNLRTTVSQLLADHRRQGGRLALIGAGVILLLLLLFLGANRGMMGVALTVALPVAATAGYLSLLGPLSLFHLIAFLLVAGLGVDYALFMARAGREADLRSLGSVWLSALSTALVFGILSFSSLPLLQEVGRTTVVGVILLLATGLALLPPSEKERTPIVDSTPITA